MCALQKKYFWPYSLCYKYTNTERGVSCLYGFVDSYSYWQRFFGDYIEKNTIVCVKYAFQQLADAEWFAVWMFRLIQQKEYFSVSYLLYGLFDYFWLISWIRFADGNIEIIKKTK